MTFGEKVKNLRLTHNLSQAELSELTGISLRSIYSYEQQNIKPRRVKNIKALADAFHVSQEYLMNDDEEDTNKNMESEIFINSVQEEFGNKAKNEATEVLEKASALFAGGTLDDEAKEIFMQSLMQVYIDSKKKAADKYGSRKKKNKKSYK